MNLCIFFNYIGNVLCTKGFVWHRNSSDGVGIPKIQFSGFVITSPSFEKSSNNGKIFEEKWKKKHCIIQTISQVGFRGTWKPAPSVNGKKGKHSAVKLEKSAISKVHKHIICIFKNGKKSIFAPEKSLKIAFLVVFSFAKIEFLPFLK